MTPCIRLDDALSGRRWGPSVVALGTFDGVHTGHQTILRRAAEAASIMGASPLALTFDRLPRTVLAPDQAPRALTSVEERCRLLSELGLVPVVAAFDQTFASMPAEAFVREILVAGLGLRRAVIGYNYTFGFEARGTPDLLRALGKEMGFDVETIEPVCVEGSVVSSSSIRKALDEGDVALARTLLGRPFALVGEVVHGAGRGRGLGYPTANLEVDPSLQTPGEGVYLSAVRKEDGEETLAHGLTVVGDRPTFADGVQAVETFLLDFNGDLYGRRVRVEFFERLRGVRKFSSAEALRLQIAEDVRRAREWAAARKA